MKRIVIVGATSAIAEACARLWVQKEPANLLLLGRNLEKLERIAADLRVRSPESVIETMQAEFLDSSVIQKTVNTIVAQNKVDIVLIAHGYLPLQQECQKDLAIFEEAININALSPAFYAEAFAQYFETIGKGKIVIIGSVAGDRGRKTNYVYGASKGLLDRLAQGMQHRFAGTDIKVILVKPGPTDTPMTKEYKQRGMKMASAEEVAKEMVESIENNRPVIYAPKKWQLIMFIVKHMPAFIFNRLNI